MTISRMQNPQQLQGIGSLRQPYGLGKLVKKAFKGVKKIAKSPLGKAALIGGLGAYGMGSLGINFLPTFWGFMAAFSEFFGGIMILFGIYIRLFSILLFITMLVAINTHISGGDGIMGASHAIESAVVFLCLFFSGAGSYSVNIDWNK